MVPSDVPPSRTASGRGKLSVELRRRACASLLFWLCACFLTVVLGAGFAPGLTCVLAAHGMSWLDTVEEIHVSKVGTGGPACALVHHRALSRISYDKS